MTIIINICNYYVAQCVYIIMIKDDSAAEEKNY